MAYVKSCLHAEVKAFRHAGVSRARDRKKGRLIIFPIDFADTEIGHGHVISQ